jgi:dTDP-4-dehydrorhamnose 3,5-epimerase
MECRSPEFGTVMGGPTVIVPTSHTDERGSFSRLFCPEELSALGVPFQAVQMSLSRNSAKYTLRGMHDQPDEWAEGKIVRVTRGSIYDVALDLRKDSPTYLKWCATLLTADNMHAFYIPRGFSHGFLTLEPDTDVLYQMDRMFVPGHGRGYRWNDPAFGIEWPHEPAVIGERDASCADFR